MRCQESQNLIDLQLAHSQRTTLANLESNAFRREEITLTLLAIKQTQQLGVYGIGLFDHVEYKRHSKLNISGSKPHKS